MFVFIGFGFGLQSRLHQLARGDPSATSRHGANPKAKDIRDIVQGFYEFRLVRFD